MRGYCYMLECSDGSYYIGSTTHLEARLYQHQTGKGAAYTRRRLPVKLVWVEEFPRVDDAFNREKQIQNWSRAKRKALIAQNYADLPRLSRNYREHGRPEGLDQSGGLDKLDQPRRLDQPHGPDQSDGLDKLDQPRRLDQFDGLDRLDQPRRLDRPDGLDALD